MKDGLHPRYETAMVVCGTCGTTWETRSTKKGPIKTELCSHCHPFFTGEQRIVDTAGQVDRFMKRMQRSKDATPAAVASPATKAKAGKEA
jgi:large subunit ribosomal protein L31